MALWRPLLNLAAAQLLKDAELDAEPQDDRHFHPRGDRVELPDHQVVKLYRLNKDLVDNIIDRVVEFHPQRRMSPKLSPQKHNISKFEANSIRSANSVWHKYKPNLYSEYFVPHLTHVLQKLIDPGNQSAKSVCHKFIPAL